MLSVGILKGTDASRSPSRVTATGDSKPNVLSVYGLFIAILETETYQRTIDGLGLLSAENNAW